MQLKKIRPFNPKIVPPPSWEGEFLNPKYHDLNIEIGCGVGLHPIQFCTKNKENYLVAIEKTRGKYNKFNSRYLNHNLPNLLPIHADAISWITHNIKSETVDQYFILYPNPWHKSEHANRRFYQMPFTSFLLKTLKVGGKITLATNIPSYAYEAREYFEKYWNLRPVSFKELNLANMTTPRTHFEKKYLKDGQTCYDLVFEKLKYNDSK